MTALLERTSLIPTLDKGASHQAVGQTQEMNGATTSAGQNQTFLESQSDKGKEC